MHTTIGVQLTRSCTPRQTKAITVLGGRLRKDKAYRGRKPSFTESQISEIIALTGGGKGVTQVAKQVGLSRPAIYRILKCPADAYASVRAWSCPIE